MAHNFQFPYHTKIQNIRNLYCIQISCNAITLTKSFLFLKKRKNNKIFELSQKSVLNYEHKHGNTDPIYALSINGIQ